MFTRKRNNKQTKNKLTNKQHHLCCNLYSVKRSVITRKSLAIDSLHFQELSYSTEKGPSSL